ncbi:MAG TPA: DUF4442 domain-containing protein [Polyangiales bacterium]|nr:DUF4442 domain-containing protein [Polyangiales bacterium]
MRTENKFTQLLARIEAMPLPRSAKQWLITQSAGLMIPYLSTSAVEFEAVGPARATLVLRNRRRVQNHMKTVHASAMFLLAEAATGTVLLANLPEGALFSTTHIEVDYTKRARGDLRASATLDEAQRTQIEREEKGNLRVPVVLHDADGNEPARFVIEWSWKHARKRSQAAA